MPIARRKVLTPDTHAIAAALDRPRRGASATADDTSARLSWWRQHGEYFCQVDPLGAAWHISIWFGSVCLIEGARPMRRLLSAKASADDLLRRKVRHRCDVRTCGAWVAVAR